MADLEAIQEKTGLDGMLAFNQLRPHVILFPGRFQPLHSGHVSAFKAAHEAFGKPLTPVVVWKKPTPNSPYPADLVSRMIESLGYDWITSPLIAQDVNLPSIVDQCRLLGFEPVGLACGIDRTKSYSQQAAKLVSGHYDAWVLKSFKVHEVDDRSHGMTSTMIRESLSAGQDSGFLDNTPEQLHRFLEELKGYR